MSGIAELLTNLGYVVSGTDEKRSAVTERLATLGIRLAYGHDAAHVGDADVVVVSSAVKTTNPEVREAARRQVPVIPRAEMLAELMRLKTAIAVAGTHGKTTTTAMIALVLERAGLDPTYVIGGDMNESGSGAQAGAGDLFVTEADESDGSFLLGRPAVGVVTNVELDHVDFYGGGLAEIESAFVAFAERCEHVVVCADDPSAMSAVAAADRP